MSDDNRTPTVRRTNSVFPGSQGGSGSQGRTDLSPGTHRLSDGTTVTVQQDHSRVVVHPNGQRQVFNAQGDLVDGGRPAQRGDKRPTHLTSSGKTATEDRADGRAQTQQKAKGKAASNNRDAADRSRAEADQRQMYVNGELVTVYNVYDADGKPRQIVSYGGYRLDGSDHAIGTSTANHAGATRDYAPNALPGLTTYQRSQRDAADQQRHQTYSILSLPDDLSTSTFILGYGQRLDQDGNNLADTQRAQVQDLDPRRGGVAGLPMNQPQKTVTNAMTVAGGVTWFRQLAHNDPGAYDELVDKLVGSGYLSQDDARHGAYTIKAGQAAGMAMIDAAQNMEAGGTDDLRTFLQKQADQVAENTKKARAAAYQPVQRTFTDPAQVMATARAAAEKMLGRSLTDAEAQTFASQFHGTENAQYDQIDAAGRSGGSATVINPDAGGEAEQMLRGPQYDGERTKQMTGGYMDALKQLIGG